MPKLKISHLSGPDNKMLNLAIGRFVRDLEKPVKDVTELYNPPKLRLAECSKRFNHAWDARFRKGLRTALETNPRAREFLPPFIVAGIVGGIIGNIVGNIIGDIINDKIS
jgi:hypothetical protein